MTYEYKMLYEDTTKMLIFVVFQQLLFSNLQGLKKQDKTVPLSKSAST